MPREIIRKNLLPACVFITGACVLIVEIVAVRALSPFYGNTIYTFSSVISVILASLSLGYWRGGILADKHPTLRRFFGIIFISSICLLALYFLGMILLPVLSMLFSITAGPLVSSFFLFFLPAFLLGMLSPYAVKLQSMQTPETGIGTVSGKIFFWSTLGSIIGSLGAGFILIPNFGIDRIFIGTGVVLGALGFIPLLYLGFGRRKKKLQIMLNAGIMLALSILFLSNNAQGDMLYLKDGIYEKIAVYEGQLYGRPARFFQQDRSSSGAMFLDEQDPSDLVYDYTKYYALYRIFNPDTKRALVIGGGAYSIPRALLYDLPEAAVDVSEIEPSLYELAKKYFRLEDSPGLRNSTEDGRRFLLDTKEPYDLIFSDVYYSLYSIPSHFTTREFFALSKEKLSENGIFIANLIGNLSRTEPSFIFSEIKTFRSVFDNSYFFAVTSPSHIGVQNIIAVGYNNAEKLDLNSPLVREHAHPLIRSLPDKAINMDRFELSPYTILTDDFAPAEHLNKGVLNQVGKRRTSPVDGREMLATIAQQLRYGPRHPSAPGHEAVKNFIIAEMATHTSEAQTQTWDFESRDGSVYPLTNIIGRLHPEKERRIILGAHYDSKKTADEEFGNPLAPVPGANDSASGVAVLLELARALSQSPVPPEVGIDFVFFDGEEGDENQHGDYSEWYPIGSTYFAERLREFYPIRQPTGAIIFDMVCDKDLAYKRETDSVEYAGEQTLALWQAGKAVAPDIFSDEVGGRIFDDHTPLNAAGIPSTLVIDFEYPYWHTTEDTLDKCSAGSLETTARAAWEYIYTLR